MARNIEAHAKSPKISALKAGQQGDAQKGSPSIMKPAKKPPAMAAKVKKMVSVAGIFKKAKTAGKTKKRAKQRSTAPEVESSELDLAGYYREGLEEARDAIATKQELAFTTVYDHLVGKLAQSHSSDEAFLERTSAVASTLGASLSDERIETTFVKDGKRVTEIVEIGKRITLFKDSVENDAARLKDLWAQWDEMQDEFIELATEVFGGQAFGKDGEKERLGKGYRHEMELLNLEHEAGLEEVIDNIENLKSKALQDSRTSEEGLIAASKSNEARMIMAYMDMA